MKAFIILALLFQITFANIDVERIIKHINVYRELHQAPAIVYSSRISEFSQSWADHMSQNNVFQHSTDSQYGENIAMTTQQDTNAVIQSIDMFYNEVQLYDFNNPVFDAATGHFTQLVWIKTTEIGIGISRSTNGFSYICTNYYPPGNYFGEFQKNVKPALSVQNSPRKLLSPPPSPSPHPPRPLLPVSPSPSPFPSPPRPLLPVSPSPSHPPRPLLPVSPSPHQPRPLLPVSPSSSSEYPFMFKEPYAPPNNAFFPPLYKRYTLSIRYPFNNVTHVNEILCPSIQKILNGKCKIQLASSNYVYYGMSLYSDYETIRQTIVFDLDSFTKNGKIVCKSTIAVYLDGDDIFRYVASKKSCVS